jgi:hypothetical protein
LLVLILSIAVIVAVAVVAALSFAPFAKGVTWRATVTPLASIIGSGFLICGPLLAKEFGAAAIWAEVALLLIAYAVGAVLRFNIANAEPYLLAASFHDRVAWLARIAQVILAFAYAISVAYYLKLLAEFGLRYVPIDPAMHGLVSNLLVTGVMATLAVLVLIGGMERAEHLAHASVSLKLGVIAGLMAALAAYWLLHGATEAAPPARLRLGGIPLLLGLLITVQGFETSRYLGHAYAPEVRIRTMRYSQWISAAIYLGFLLLLWPFLARAARAPGVAGILDIMELAAPFMGVFVLVGAVSSQLSAATADSIGSAGLLNEVSRRKFPLKTAFATASALALAVVWLTDPFQVIALSSRAFALFYALQCLLAIWVARRTRAGGWRAQAAIAVVGIICLIATAMGAPAE